MRMRWKISIIVLVTFAGILGILLLLTSCSYGYKESQPSYLPKVHITYENKKIGWLQGDATFTGKVNGVSNINYVGAKREEALKLHAVKVKSYDSLNITPEAIKGLSKPKISAMLYNKQGEITGYTLVKDNKLNIDGLNGEYLWMIYVDWGNGENNSIYWFKINAVKDKNYSGPQITEPGPVPVSVIWDGREYQVTGGTTKGIGSKLGTAIATGNAGTREIYSIKGYDTKREIAIAQLGGQYFKAVAFTAHEKENMLKQSMLNEMYTYVITKKFNLPNCDYDYSIKYISEGVDRFASSDKGQYDSVIDMLKTGKYKEAADLIDKLQNTVSEVKY